MLIWNAMRQALRQGLDFVATYHIFHLMATCLAEGAIRGYGCRGVRTIQWQVCRRLERGRERERERKRKKTMKKKKNNEQEKIQKSMKSTEGEKHRRNERKKKTKKQKWKEGVRKKCWTYINGSFQVRFSEISAQQADWIQTAMPNTPCNGVTLW